MKVYDVAKYQILMHQGYLPYNSISEVFTINTEFYLCAKAIFSQVLFFKCLSKKLHIASASISENALFFILQYQTKSQDANKAKFDIKPHTNDSKLRSAVSWETSSGRSRVGRGYEDTF